MAYVADRSWSGQHLDNTINLRPLIPHNPTQNVMFLPTIWRSYHAHRLRDVTSPSVAQSERLFNQCRSSSSTVSATNPAVFLYTARTFDRANQWCKTLFSLRFYPRDARLARALAMAWCLSVSVSVCPSVRHKSVSYQNEWTDRAGFGMDAPFDLSHRKFGYLQK